MEFKISTEEILLNNGNKITLETGKLARQADGSVVLKMGGTMLLATVVSSKHVDPSIDFLPLTVDYKEKFGAAGKFPGGFTKREGRSTDNEILTMRLADRVLRPLFPEDYHAETQIMVQLVSYEEGTLPDALVGLAASAALAVSDIPFNGPISEVRVSRINGKFIINPNREELNQSNIDMIIGASMDSVVMVEGEMNEISETEMIEAIKCAHEAIKLQIQAQMRLAEKAGVLAKRDYEKPEIDENLKNLVFEKSYKKFYQTVTEGSSKQEVKGKFIEISEQVIDELIDEIPEREKLIKDYLQQAKKKAVRDVILKENIRLDQRKTTDIRPISCEVDYLPTPHGSAIFTRGETQSLTTVTLGTSSDRNRTDMPSYKGEEHFYLHYNFPPFSTGEVKALRGISRREIGHGNLAQRALKPIIPADCPYTVRVVSDILESNGSSSMATVCAGTLALMDAGIQIKSPVSGIAMGLITDKDTEEYAILSDILGDEDHLGDMDFKVTGTKDGITACQMDIKISGLSYEVLEKALSQANTGRMYILEKLTNAIAKPRIEVKEAAPKIKSISIPKDMIGTIIGPGGKNIQALQSKNNVSVIIEEKETEGIIEVLGCNKSGIDDVIKTIEHTVFLPVSGQDYEVTVTKILDFGAVVEFVPGKEVLLHISEIDWRRVENVNDEFQIGEKIKVRYLGADPKTGKQKVSRKVLLPKE